MSLRDEITPSIYPLVNSLIKKARIGICAGSVRIFDIRTGRPSIVEKPNGDRFKLAIPFAGITLEWDVIFFGSTADHPPDFIFDDKTFLPDPRKLESLMNWNKDDPDVLMRLIEQLVYAYQKHQIHLLNLNERIKFEYESLLDNTNFTKNDVEVVQLRKSKLGAVNFLIRLPVDLSKIPPVYLNGNPGEDSVVLLIIFNTRDCTKIAPQIYLSPRVENAFGGSANLRIPNYPVGGCLMDYVPHVQDLIQNKVITQVEVGYERRKEYISAFLSHFGSSILEFDMELFTKLSFLFEKDEFFFVVHINLPQYFPQDKPIIVLQSVYTFTRSSGQPCYSKYDDYPYSSRWSPDEMAEKAREFILNNIDNFKRNTSSSYYSTYRI